LGESIVKKAKEENLSLLDSKNFQAIADSHRATIDSKRVLLGNLRLMEEKKVSLNGLLNKAEQLSNEGKTSMFLAWMGAAVSSPLPIH